MSSMAQALALYHKTLRQIEGRLGKTTTDENQLNDEGTRLFGSGFLGVFASDKVPRMSNKHPYLIANTDKSGSGGSHWLALAHYPKAPGKVFLYDSFGRPTKKLVPWIVKGKGVVDAEYDAEQTGSESNCGQRCLAWLVVFDQLGPDAALTI